MVLEEENYVHKHWNGTFGDPGRTARNLGTLVIPMAFRGMIHVAALRLVIEKMASVRFSVRRFRRELSVIEVYTFLVIARPICIIMSKPCINKSGGFKGVTTQVIPCLKTKLDNNLDALKASVIQLGGISY